jgi:hypothetical protein
VYEGRPQTRLHRRTGRDKLRKLVEYDLIVAEGHAHERTYSVVDASIESVVDLETGELATE